MPGVIVPRKTVSELRKLIDEADGVVEVGAVGFTKIRYAFDKVELTSKLIDGTFPDYERVIPTGNTKMMQVDCKAPLPRRSTGSRPSPRKKCGR